MRWRAHNDCTRGLWHSHFAWWPVKVGNVWVWFEPVKRVGTLHTLVNRNGVGAPTRTWTWEYDLPEK